MSKKTVKKEKKVPIRTCISCQNKAPKYEMIRLVRLTNGLVSVDDSGKIRGRGANLCEDLNCLNDAIKKGKISRSLQLETKLNEGQSIKLQKEFEKVLYEREFRRGKKPVTFRVTKDKFNDVLKK